MSVRTKITLIFVIGYSCVAAAVYFLFTHFERDTLLSLVVGCLGGSLVVGYFFLHRSLFGRLSHMSSTASRIRDLGDTSIRLQSASNDELGKLANAINAMLDALHTAHQQLALACEAERANAAKSRFLASVSHELRTPLHGILGLLRMLHKNENSTSKSSYIQMAYNTTEGLLETINDLLDMSKAEAGKLALDPREFSPRHVVREVLQAIGPRAHEKERMEIACAVGPEVPQLLVGDPQRLKQIVMNLVGNAVKFTNQGTIQLLMSTVETEPDRVILRLCCRDTGMGIAAEKLRVIFEAYEQVDVRDATQGTGLGLSVVRQLTETMGGKLHVASTLGMGSEFTVEIPFPVVRRARKLPERLEGVYTVSAVQLFHDSVRTMLEPFAIIPEAVPTISSIPGGDRPNRVVIDGKLFREPNAWMELDGLRKNRTGHLVVLVTSGELIHRERLELLGVDEILVRPCLPDDLWARLSGDASRSFPAETSLTANLIAREVRPAPRPDERATEVKTVEVDFPAILVRCGGLPRIAMRVVQSFASSAPSLYGELRRAIDTEDRAEIQSRVHALKGMLLEVGCQSASTLAAWIEDHSLESSIHELTEAVDRLSAQVEDLARQAEQLLGNRADEPHASAPGHSA